MRTMDRRRRITDIFLVLGLFVLLALGLAAGHADAAGNTGWVQDSGVWYYYDNSGTAQTGWVWYNGSWYYMDASGVMQTGWLEVNGVRYYLQPNGRMSTGWQKLDGVWYYFGTNGHMTTGWQYVNGIWYYMDEAGVMQTGWIEYNGVKYDLQSNGRMATGWLKENGVWYYFGTNGHMATGWAQAGGNWYYLGTDGIMQTGWIEYNGVQYYLQSNGRMATYWLKLDGVWYYFGSNGRMQSDDWIWYNGGWYFLQDNGQLATSVWIGDNYGNSYYVNASGKWISNSSTKAERDAAAAEVAQDIARYIMDQDSLTTDLDRVYAASQIVYNFFLSDQYTMSGSIYNTAYGVFIGGEASCAGATRALGLVLTYMGFSWTHVNENQYSHQWCQLYMDGRIGWADAGSGMAGYGDFALAGLYGV